MSNAPVVSVTDELIAALEAELAAYESPTLPVRGVNLQSVKALLAERKELKLDALRYRHIVPRLSHYAGGRTGVSMPSDYSTSTKEQCDAAIDAAMQS